MTSQKRQEKKKNKRLDKIKAKTQRRRTKIREEKKLDKELEKLKWENREKIEPIVK